MYLVTHKIIHNKISYMKLLFFILDKCLICYNMFEIHFTLLDKYLNAVMYIFS